MAHVSAERSAHTQIFEQVLVRLYLTTLFGEIQTGLGKLRNPLTKPFSGVAWELHCRNPCTAPFQPAVALTLLLQARHQCSRFRDPSTFSQQQPHEGQFL